MSTFTTSRGPAGDQQARLAADASAPRCPTCHGPQTARLMETSTWADVALNQSQWIVAEYECVTGHLISSPSRPRSSSIDDLLTERVS